MVEASRHVIVLLWHPIPQTFSNRIGHVMYQCSGLHVWVFSLVNPAHNPFLSRI